jgi:hypothetical protein
MLAASVASAADVKLWLSDSSGGMDGIYDLAPSETAVIQLWLDIPAFTTPARALVNIDTILSGYDKLWGDTVSFEVQGFNDIAYTEPDWQRTTRGAVVAQLPHGDIDDYQYVGESMPNPAPPTWDATKGWMGPAVVLLDEIIIHCTGYSPDLDGDLIQDADKVTFSMAIPPGGFELYWKMPGASWDVRQIAMSPSTTTLTFLNGTYSNPFEVLNPVPEPATLGLLVLGGLAAFRRR